MENPMAGRSQSNLWFGKWNDLKAWGPADGWGGPWMNDSVQAGVPSDPFLINGFDKKILHLTDSASQPVQFTLEIDKKGNNQWEVYRTITVAANGYAYLIFPASFCSKLDKGKSKPRLPCICVLPLPGETRCCLAFILCCHSIR